MMVFKKTADEIILNRYSPAAVVVTESLDIVLFRGNTAPFLQPPTGKPSYHLLKMARSGLVFELRNLLHKVKKTNSAVIREDMQVEIENHQHTITIEVVPLPNTPETYYLILFRNHYVPAPRSKSKSDTPNAIKDRRIQELENELLQNKEDSRAIIENHEVAHEEFQSANEELLSSAEELQSLNEEMETSKEELQTTNEELIVVNQELVGLNEQVTEARDYAESIISTVRTPLLVLDDKLCIVMANNIFYTTFKVQQSEIEGKSIYLLGNGQWNIPSLRTLLQELVPKNSNIRDFEVRHHFPEIGDRVMLLNASEIIREKKENKSILLAIEDVTEAVALHEEEEHFTQFLQNKIQEATTELTVANRELEDKNEKLRNLNKELQAFTYISSHDLQEPLRKIQTFINRLFTNEASSLSEKGTEYFNRIQEASHQMQQLIEDLLVYSRTQFTEKKYEYTHLNGVVESCLDDMAELIKEKNAIIETDELGSLFINTSQFRQVFTNLIGNAMKFCDPSTPPRIKISGRRGPGSELQETTSPSAATELKPGRTYCHIMVSDNGIGFDAQYKDQIFDVFERLYGKDEYPGTGIGLAIVKKIIDNHEGVISASSETGKGSTFNIYIPCDLATEAK